MPRKTKTEELTTITDINVDDSASIADGENTDMEKVEETITAASPVPSPEETASAVSTVSNKSAPASILTLNSDTEIETPESREEIVWH